MSETIMSKALGILCDRCEIMSADCAHYPCELYVEMEQLLSLQPEIIHCKDCKHHPKDEWFGCPMSHLNEKQRPETAWCWKGERRTDEQTD